MLASNYLIKHSSTAYGAEIPLIPKETYYRGKRDLPSSTAYGAEIPLIPGLKGPGVREHL